MSYDMTQFHQLSCMGLVRLKIRELAAQKGWTLKEVSDRSGVIYRTVRSYARRPEMAMVDFTAIHKLPRTFDVMIEDGVEILEESLKIPDSSTLRGDSFLVCNQKMQLH